MLEERMERLDTKHSVGPQEWYPHHTSTSHWCCPSYYAGAYPYCPHAYSSFSHPYNYGTGIEWQHPYSHGYGQTHYSHGGIASTVDAQPVTHQVPQTPLKLDNTGEGPLTLRREVPRREQHQQGVRDRKPTTSTSLCAKDQCPIIMVAVVVTFHGSLMVGAMSRTGAQ